MIGARPSMEDKHIIKQLFTGHTLLAVFDGHGGVLSANRSSQRLVHHIKSSAFWKDYVSSYSEKVDTTLIEKALYEAIFNMDEDLRVYLGSDDHSGSTCICAFVTPSHIICANVGDSRCVLLSGLQVVNLSVDHKPNRLDEATRIKACGGFVQRDRVNAQLAVSRYGPSYFHRFNILLTRHAHLCLHLNHLHDVTV